jgi:hypothetical protein
LLKKKIESVRKKLALKMPGRNSVMEIQEIFGHDFVSGGDKGVDGSFA